MKSDHAPALLIFHAASPANDRCGLAGACRVPELAAKDLLLELKWGLLLPGAPEPRLTLLRRQGFRSVFQTALRGLSNRSIVVICNYGLVR